MGELGASGHWRWVQANWNKPMIQPHIRYDRIEDRIEDSEGIKEKVILTWRTTPHVVFGGSSIIHIDMI